MFKDGSHEFQYELEMALVQFDCECARVRNEVFGTPEPLEYVTLEKDRTRGIRRKRNAHAKNRRAKRFEEKYHFAMPKNGKAKRNVFLTHAESDQAMHIYDKREKELRRAERLDRRDNKISAGFFYDDDGRLSTWRIKGDSVEVIQPFGTKETLKLWFVTDSICYAHVHYPWRSIWYDFVKEKDGFFHLRSIGIMPSGEDNYTDFTVDDDGYVW